jgi:hypothetical protein
VEFGMADRKKPGVAFWATVVLVVMVAYIASVAPAQYLAAHRILPAWSIDVGQWLYLPLALLPAPINGWLERYADWFAHAIP